MHDTTNIDRYKELYIALKEIIQESEQRILSEDEDKLFLANINFFIKSYLVTTCTYLEAYLQDTAYAYAMDVNNRLKNAKIPHNFVFWKTNKNVKDNVLKFTDTDLFLSKKEISDDLSPNVGKTITLFKYLGIDLQSNLDFLENKDIVGAVVEKRNNIIHHNDEATDISFSDLLSFIDVFLAYIEAIEETVKNNLSS